MKLCEQIEKQIVVIFHGSIWNAVHGNVKKRYSSWQKPLLKLISKRPRAWTDKDEDNLPTPTLYSTTNMRNASKRAWWLLTTMKHGVSSVLMWSWRSAADAEEIQYNSWKITNLQIYYFMSLVVMQFSNMTMSRTGSKSVSSMALDTQAEFGYAQLTI